MRLADSASGTVFVEEDAPLPEAGRGEVLVRVFAAGVTVSELLWYPTLHTKSGEKRSGAIPGHEFSGVIAAVGEDVAGFEVGDEVYGMNDWFAEGATAEYCVTLASSVARKPSSLTHAEAASVPIGALTAWQGLIDRAKLQAGETVLVQGGAGAVGVFAVQLAKIHGARVIATVSARNLDLVAKLGADEGIDYRTTRFEERVRDVDVVFDTVGGETLSRSWGVLKPEGRMVTIASEGESTQDERTKQAFFIVEPNQKQLIEIGALLQSGALKTVVDAVVPFAEASAAYLGQVAVRNGYGKLVVAVA